MYVPAANVLLFQNLKRNGRLQFPVLNVARKPIWPESLATEEARRCKHGRRTAACESVIVYIRASATNAAQGVNEVSDSATEKVVQWLRLGRLRRCS